MWVPVPYRGGGEQVAHRNRGRKLPIDIDTHPAQREGGMSERYQQEIEEILGKIEELSPDKVKPPRRSFSNTLFAGLGRLLGGRNWSLSPGRIMLGSLVLLLVALLFRASMPGIVAPMAWMAVVLFILGYALFFISPRTPNEKRWRGEVVESTPKWWDRLRRWAKDR